jgi:hypothetical protein
MNWLSAVASYTKNVGVFRSSYVQATLSWVLTRQLTNRWFWGMFGFPPPFKTCLDQTIACKTHLGQTLTPVVRCGYAVARECQGKDSNQTRPDCLVVGIETRAALYAYRSVQPTIHIAIYIGPLSIDSREDGEFCFERATRHVPTGWVHEPIKLTVGETRRGASSCRTLQSGTVQLYQHIGCRLELNRLARSCLDTLQIPSFFTLSPSHQFLDACIEHSMLVKK